MPYHRYIPRTWAFFPNTFKTDSNSRIISLITTLSIFWLILSWYANKVSVLVSSLNVTTGLAMATLGLVLDKRRQKKDGTYPLVFQVIMDQVKKLGTRHKF